MRAEYFGLCVHTKQFPPIVHRWILGSADQFGVAAFAPASLIQRPTRRRKCVARRWLAHAAKARHPTGYRAAGVRWARGAVAAVHPPLGGGSRKVHTLDGPGRRLRPQWRSWLAGHDWGGVAGRNAHQQQGSGEPSGRVGVHGVQLTGLPG